MDMNQYRELSIGMDDLFSRLFEASNNQAFPPYNLYRIEDNKFKVEMALAGYSKNDIEITIKDGLLVIKSSNNPSNLYERYIEYKGHQHVATTKDNVPVIELHRGISGKQFKRSFQLSENVKVVNAYFIEGILTIDLEQIIPEERLPKTIAIK